GLFFRASAVLMAFLAVVFAGKGIAALQEAGVLPAHALALPSLPLFGVYPSLQGLLVQALLIVAIAAGFLHAHRAARQGAPAEAP
ncbi:MAG TPA: cytochrome C, partial [Candidatus Methylomirabilis sp.]|nr:cytochrome C [Candidatus Methylomirabilis sp.]